MAPQASKPVNPDFAAKRLAAIEKFKKNKGTAVVLQHYRAREGATTVKTTAICIGAKSEVPMATGQVKAYSANIGTIHSGMKGEMCIVTKEAIQEDNVRVRRKNPKGTKGATDIAIPGTKDFYTISISLPAGSIIPIRAQGVAFNFATAPAVGQEVMITLEPVPSWGNDKGDYSPERENELVIFWNATGLTVIPDGTSTGPYQNMARMALSGAVASKTFEVTPYKWISYPIGTRPTDEENMANGVPGSYCIGSVLVDPNYCFELKLQAAPPLPERTLRLQQLMITSTLAIITEDGDIWTYKVASTLKGPLLTSMFGTLSPNDLKGIAALISSGKLQLNCIGSISEAASLQVAEYTKATEEHTGRGLVDGVPTPGGFGIEPIYGMANTDAFKVHGRKISYEAMMQFAESEILDILPSYANGGQFWLNEEGDEQSETDPTPADVLSGTAWKYMQTELQGSDYQVALFGSPQMRKEREATGLWSYYLIPEPRAEALLKDFSGELNPTTMGEFLDSLIKKKVLKRRPKLSGLVVAFRNTK